jgi:hypothetical protein
MQESYKSSCLTGRTLSVTKKLFYTICDVGHPPEVVFVESTHVFLDEMIGNHDDCLTFELQSLPGVSEVIISVVTLFSLESEVSAKLFGHILWENVRRVDGWVTEVKHTQTLFLFGSSINLYSVMGFLLPLMAEGLSLFVLAVVGSRLPPLCCSGVEVVLEVGRDEPSVGGILFILPWSAGLGVIPRINGVGGNGTRHDHNSGHGSLMQVDLGVKCLQDC